LQYAPGRIGFTSVGADLRSARKKIAGLLSTQLLLYILKLNRYIGVVGRISYNALKAEKEQHEMLFVETKKREGAEALEKVKELCQAFGFTAGALKGALAEG
jgi:hypothetical protein